jgi:precorrin-6B methylase 2
MLLGLLSSVAMPGESPAQRFSEEPPYIPTEMELVNEMLRLGGVGPGDVLLDLGSGDGRIVIEAARRFGTRGIGYEHQEPLVALSRARADSLGVAHLTRFVADDLFAADISSASVVVIYLGAAFNLRLRPILLSQLAPGARVVSNTFHMGDWRPDSTLHVGSGADRSTLHSWIIPARVDGFWSFAIEGEADGYALELEQRFQTARGVARGRRDRLPIPALRIRGEHVEFGMAVERSGEITFRGTVQGDRMEGTADFPDGTRRWIALRFTHPGLAPRESPGVQ